ncbi:MAG: MBL fold metallo-hydrolase [Thermoleophilia bacterium]|nr:MBL fold metallo-hydrolase [Thermoleophilia bacterium]
MSRNDGENAMELVVLGSAGWIPQQERMTTSLALRVGDVLVVLDAGTGVARLLEPGLRRLLPPPGSAVHVFLSHYHLDHTAGLTYLPVLWPGNPTTVYGPVPPGARPATYGACLIRLLARRSSPTGSPASPWRWTCGRLLLESR